MNLSCYWFFRCTILETESRCWMLTTKVPPCPFWPPILPGDPTSLRRGLSVSTSRGQGTWPGSRTRISGERSWSPDASPSPHLSANSPRRNTTSTHSPWTSPWQVGRITSAKLLIWKSTNIALVITIPVPFLQMRALVWCSSLWRECSRNPRKRQHLSCDTSQEHSSLCRR